MEGTIILDFAWVLIFATIASMVSTRFNFPLVVGLLLAGMVAGPNVFDLIEPPTIEAFAEIGAVLLLFMIGISFSVTKLLATGPRTVISGFLLILTTFAIMHEAALLLGFDELSSIFIGSVFSLSSTAIMMRILERKGLLERKEMPFLVTMLIVEDIVAIFMLTFFSSLKTGAFTTEGIIGAVIIALAVLAFVYIVLLRILKNFSELFLKEQSEDTIILFSFTFGIGMSTAAALLGLSPAIGAFLAGSIIAGLPNGQLVEKTMRPFSHVFSSFFFLSVGMLINPATLLASADLAAILILCFMAAVFLGSAFAIFLVMSSGRSAVFSGLAMLPLGEFSLLIASQSVGLIDIDLVGIASIGVLVTSALSSFSLKRDEQLYLWFKCTLPKGFLGLLHRTSDYFIKVIHAFERTGYFTRIFLSDMRRYIADITYVSGTLVFFFFARQYLAFDVTVAGFAFRAELLLLAVLFVLSIIQIARVFAMLIHIMNVLSAVVSRTTPQAGMITITRNMLVGLVLLAAWANWHLAVDFLRLPHVFNWLSVVAFALSMLFLWSAARASSLWLFVKRHRFLGMIREKIDISEEDLIVVGRSKRSKKKKNN